MKISIVTISFNQSSFIERAIESVLSQGFPDLEYIVVDGGSTDGSVEIIEKYKEKLFATLIGKDKGPADGLNKGFQHATGDVLAYINADDEFLPGAFKKVASEFSKAPTLDVVYGHGYIVQGDSKRKFFSDPFDTKKYAYGAVSVLQQATFFRREAFESVGGFNVENRTCWDGELLLEFGLRNMKFRVLDEFLGVFRIHGESISGSGRMTQQYERDLDRLFRRAIGRRRNGMDALLAQAFRAQKWLRSPRALQHRLFDFMSGKYR